VTNFDDDGGGGCGGDVRCGDEDDDSRQYCGTCGAGVANCAGIRNYDYDYNMAWNVDGDGVGTSS
jgi:hypothetical protein